MDAVYTFNIGDGATYQVGSDRYAGTITAVSPNGKTVWWRKDDVKLVSGDPRVHEQVYEYTFREDADPEHDSPFTLRRQNGRYVLVHGHYAKGLKLVPGRDQYRDPSY